MTSRTRPGIAFGVFVASIAAHWVVLWALPHQVAQPAEADSRPAAVQFEIARRPPQAPATPRRPLDPGTAKAASSSAGAIEPPHASQRALGASASTPTPPSAEPPGAPAAPSTARVPPPVATTAPKSAPDLSPRAAAMSMLEPLSMQKPLSDELSQSEAGPTGDGVAFARQRSAELSADLAAAAVPTVARQRPPLELRRDPDGTCHFEGHSVHATILPDGGVIFEDLPPRAQPQLGEPVPPKRPVTPEEAEAPQQLSLGVGVSGRAVEAERKWFLRQTRDLRDELADTVRRQELARARTALRSELERIWCDPGKSPTARRRAIFERWDQTSADEIGQHGRDTVIDFIQRRIPEGTKLAYSTAELASLNARRQQHQPFEPYSRTHHLDAGVN